MEKGTAEVIVKIYAILAWLGALFCVIGGLVIIVGGGILGSLDAAFGTGVMGGIFGALGVVLGIFMLALAVLEVFVGIGLWKHQNWARIVTLVFSALGVLSILSLDIIGFVIGGLGVWLFGFEKTVVGLFGAKPVATKKGKK